MVGWVGILVEIWTETVFSNVVVISVTAAIFLKKKTIAEEIMFKPNFYYF